MDYQILSILPPPEVDRILGELSRQQFSEGRHTALGAASHVKRNLQLEQPASVARLTANSKVTTIEPLVLIATPTSINSLIR